MPKKLIYNSADLYLGILGLISLIVYISLISTSSYVNKNSPEWSKTSVENKKYVGYTNMVGNLFAIFLCGFDGIVFGNASSITIEKYIGKLVVMFIFIVMSYDVATENNAYGKFNAALQPLVGYLQVLSIATITQIVIKLDKKSHVHAVLSSSPEEFVDKGYIERYIESPTHNTSSSELVSPQRFGQDDEMHEF